MYMEMFNLCVNSLWLFFFFMPKSCLLGLWEPFRVTPVSFLS